MKTSCCRQPRLGSAPPARGPRRGCQAIPAALSALALILMPKCPICLAAQTALLTGLSLSTTAATHVHTALICLCGSILVGAMAMWLRAASGRRFR